MKPEFFQEVIDQMGRTIISRLEAGDDPKRLEELFNSHMFAMGMERGWDGWPRVSINPETETITFGVEGWSKLNRDEEF